MTGRERLEAAINHSEPDHIPYDLAGTTVTGISRKAYVRAMKYKSLPPIYDEKLIDPIQQIVTPSEEMLKVLRSDTRRLGARRIPDFEDIAKSADGIIELSDTWGCIWRMDESKDFYFNQYSYPLEKYDSITEGLKHYSSPDPQIHAATLRRDLYRQAAAISDFGVIADRNCAGLTEISLRLRGYENWFLDTVTDPHGVEKLFDIILDFKTAYWNIIIDWLFENKLSHLVSVVSECDDLGSQTSTILEPDYLRAAVIPRFGRLWSHIKSRLPGTKIFMHTCGSVRQLLPDLIEAGLDIYNPVQFNATNMDLRDLKKDFGGDLVFWGGGVNTQSTLREENPEVVRDEVKRIIDIMAPGGGFVFTPVHNIQEDVPPENFWAMWETLMEYGKY